MATKTLLKNAWTLVDFIQKAGTEGIHKFDLMDKASMSISQFDKMSPYLKHRFSNKVEYNQKSQKWFPLKSKEFVDKENEVID